MKKHKQDKQELIYQLLKIFHGGSTGGALDTLKRSKPIIKLSKKIYTLGYKQGLKESRKK